MLDVGDVRETPPGYLVESLIKGEDVRLLPSKGIPQV